MKQSRFYIPIISLLFCWQVNGQTVDEIIRFANDQYEQENFSIASKEYNRAFYFGSSQQDWLSLKIANCYINLNKLELASVFYDKAYRLSNNDSIQNEAILGNAFCLLMQEKYVLSISELLNLNETANKQQQTHYHFLKGIAHFQIHQDSIAEQEFQKALTLRDVPKEKIEQLETEFDNIYLYNKRYKPKVAYIMSGIIPGSGQFYSGAIKDGINSMVLVGGLFFIAMEVVKYYTLLDAAIALFPWVQRYYLGGMDKSEGLAQQKLQKKRYESYLKIVEISTPNSF